MSGLLFIGSLSVKKVMTGLCSSMQWIYGGAREVYGYNQIRVCKGESQVGRYRHHFGRYAPPAASMISRSEFTRVDLMAKSILSAMVEPRIYDRPKSLQLRAGLHV